MVELVALDGRDDQVLHGAELVCRRRGGQGGIYNFVTKRGKCAGAKSKISWTQVETGSAITWKYPSVILQGDDSVGEFYSVAVVNGRQQADTGTKMIHIGKNTTQHDRLARASRPARGKNSYRGLVKVLPKAAGARNYTQCDSMLIGNRCGAHTFPYIDVQNATAHGGARGVDVEDRRGPDLLPASSAASTPRTPSRMIVNGFCKEVFKELPMEFAVEAQKLLGVTLEGSVG